MWRLVMCVLCLIAALSGTPLRQAEAASDFARSLGELGEGHVIELIDGGVGDDTEASILNAGGDMRSLHAVILLELADLPFEPPLVAIAPPDDGGRRLAGLSEALPISSARRFAWLERFLF
jgi:hypothetical protein